MSSTDTRTPFDCGAPRLDAPPLRFLAAILPSIYAETRLDHLPAIFARALSQLTPAESYRVIIHDDPSGKSRWQTHPATPQHDSLLPEFLENQPEFAPAQHRRHTGSGAALALSDFVAFAELQLLRIYRAYYQPLGVEDELNIRVRAGATVITIAALRVQCGFTVEERELMNALRPHFKQAWINAESVAEIQACATSAPASSGEFAPESLELRYGLTPRESEVLTWIAEGKTNPEVAIILGVRPNTVRTHVEHVFEKLGVETRHAAALCALESLGAHRSTQALRLSA